MYCALHNYDFHYLHPTLATRPAHICVASCDAADNQQTISLVQSARSELLRGIDFNFIRVHGHV